MHKEAEAEAHLYGDKERFMTSAYKRGSPSVMSTKPSSGRGRRTRRTT